MNKILFLALAGLFSFQCSCQTDSTTLLNEAAKKLNSGESVSTILADKAFLPVHPSTRFRELIKSHATNSKLIITTPDEPGKKTRVMVEIKSKNGQAIPNVLVYLYQTDARGWYAADAPHVQQMEGDMRHARLFGYVKTDQQGRFELNTIKPLGYPRSDLPAHIHVHVWADGYRSLITEFLFDDDERLVGQIRERAEVEGGMISKPEKAVGPFEQQFAYSIILKKD